MIKGKKIVMIYKVRIFSPSGKILKVISNEALSKRHWAIFEDGKKPIFQKGSNFNKSKKVNKIKSGIIAYLDRSKLESY